MAQGDDLGGVFDNAQAALVSGECNPTDQFLFGTNMLPHPVTERFSSLAATRIADRHTVGRTYGTFVGTFAFQTAQFIWWLQQVCATTGASAPYTHTITTSALTAPKSFGIHLEHESTSSSRRRDLLGIIPRQLIIYGSARDQWAFRQTLTCDYAYCNKTAADIAAQTKRSSITEGTVWKNWAHICESDGTGLGGHAMDVLTYNTDALDMVVNSLAITLTNNAEFIGYDSAGYYRDAILHGFDAKFELGFIAKGNDVIDLVTTAYEDYAGDLDLTLPFTEHADNDEITMNWDKLYLVPFGEEAVEWNKWREEYVVTFELGGTSSSLATVGEDSLTEGDYENTA